MRRSPLLLGRSPVVPEDREFKAPPAFGPGRAQHLAVPYTPPSAGGGGAKKHRGETAAAKEMSVGDAGMPLSTPIAIPICFTL